MLCTEMVYFTVFSSTEGVRPAHWNPQQFPKLSGHFPSSGLQIPCPPPASLHVCTRVCVERHPHLLGLHGPCSSSQPSLSPPLGRRKNVRDPWGTQLPLLPPICLPQCPSSCSHSTLLPVAAAPIWAPVARLVLPPHCGEVNFLKRSASSLLCNLPWLPCLQNQVSIISCWIPPDADPEAD